MGLLSILEGNLIFCLTKRVECGGRELEHSGWQREIKTLDIFMEWLLKGKEGTSLREKKILKELGRLMRMLFRAFLWSSILDCSPNHNPMILTVSLNELRGLLH